MNQLREEALRSIEKANDLEAIEQLRVSLLGKSGSISQAMKELGKLDPEERKARGAELNVLKNEVTEALDANRKRFEARALEAKLARETVDISLDARPEPKGSIHPVSQVIEELVAYFGAQGFALAEGPDVETDFYNFTALNIPESHPARQMHDTFYLKDAEGQETRVLRTHTSSVQIRTMQDYVRRGQKPPIRIIAPGRTYRSDSDQTHTPMFHQLEGLYIDKNVTMAHLKGVIIGFIETFFGLENVPVRFRPSFFPFTEPSAEVDIGCKRTKESIEIGAGTDWLEILGCGMVHPNVLKSVGIDPTEYQGFAFGVGLERLAMLKYGAPDLRAFFENDTRWLSHFGFDALDIPGSAGGK